MEHHGDLCTPEFWWEKQEQLKRGIEDEVFPYPHRRRFPLAEPGTDADLWLRVALSHLESLTLGARLAGAWLLASPARPVVRQDGLFETGLNDPHAFWENLARAAELHQAGVIALTLSPYCAP